MADAVRRRSSRATSSRTWATRSSTWRRSSTGPFVDVRTSTSRRASCSSGSPTTGTRSGPYLDRVEWTIGTDAELAVLQVQDGEIDMIMDRIPNATAVQLRDDPELEGQLLIGPVNLLYYHTLNVQSEALKDDPCAQGDRDGARPRAPGTDAEGARRSP